MIVTKIRIDQISVGLRYRENMGDLQALATRMRDNPIPAPIIVAKFGSGYKLLAGFRRLRATRDILGHSTISAIVTEATDELKALLVQRDENYRKDPDPIEAANLGMRIEALLGGRQGQRQLPAILPEVKDILSEGAETREVAAGAAGFSSTTAYRNAKKVATNGTKNLKAAVSDGTLSVSDAAAVATEPSKVQDGAVRAVRNGHARTARSAIDTAVKGDADEGPMEVFKDAEGVIVPAEAVAAFQGSKDVDAMCRELDRLTREVEQKSKLPGWECINAASTMQTLRNVRQHLHSNRATHVCPYCHGRVSNRSNKASCGGCKGRGWVTKAVYNQAPKED